MSATPEWEQNLTERGLLPGTWFGDDLEVNTRVDYPDKYRGALVACGIGDALGRAVESWSADDIAEVHGTLRDYTPTPEGAPAGILTDDTEQTIAIAQSIVEHGEVVPRDIADRFAAWRHIGRGIGITTTQSIDRYLAGHPWWTAGVVTAGNGAAMRTAPIGLFRPTDVGALRRDAALAAVVTHGDPMAIASAVAQSWTVAYLLHTEPGRLDITHYLAGLARVVGDIPDTGHPERDGDPNIPIRLVDRILEVGGRLDDTPRQLFAHTYTGAFVLESLPAALWCFLRSPDDPEQVIITAVNGGHDTDTVAAMAGAVVGAYLGEKSLPERWLDGLEYLDGLERLAERLFDMTALPGEVAPWRDPGPATNDTYRPVTIDGKEYPTLEHARSAASAGDAATAEQIRLLPTPADARKLTGRPMSPTDAAPVDLAEVEARLKALGGRKKMRPGDRIPMSWDEYERIGEFWGEYVDGRLIAGPLRTATHQDLMAGVRAILGSQLERPLRVIHQWGWKPANDDFIPDVMVFDESDARTEDVRLLSTPHLVVEVISDDLASDFFRKVGKYAAAGLERFWVIDPGGPEVIVHHLVDGVLVEQRRHGPGTTVTLKVGPTEVTFDPASLLD